MTPEHDLVPNFTQFPNKLMDYVIPLLREGEEKVLIYVLRCTYGYRDQDGKQKEQDYISYSQFLGGQVSKEGKLLNFGAGVSRATLVEALAFHQATGLIERLDHSAGKSHAGRGSTGLYRLNRHCELVQFLNQCLQDTDTSRKRMVQFLNQKRLLVQNLNHSEKKPKKDKTSVKISSESELIKNGSETEPEMVQNLNQQYKEKETKKEKEKTTAVSPLENISQPMAQPIPLPMGEGVAVKSSANRSLRGTRLPSDWTPTTADIKWAQKKGYHTLITMDDATEEFCRYWWSLARNNTKLDWSMTWKNRIQELATRERDRRQKDTAHMTPAKRIAKFVE